MSHKKLDPKGRFRNRTVAFRASDEEAALLDNLVKISGLSKRDYIMRKLTDRTVVVQGNPKVYKALKDLMSEIQKELLRIKEAGSVSEELLITIQQIAVVLGGLKEECDYGE